MILCQDSDLLYWDPSVFNSSQGQLVANNSGALNGTVLTVTALDLLQFDVQPGQVVSLSGAVVGLFPITDVTTGTLTLSLLTTALNPDDGSSPQAIPPSTYAGSVNFSIRTFWQYRRTISDQLLALAGITPSLDGRTPTLLNPQDFKRAAVLGTLFLIYNALAASYTGTAPTNWEDRAVIYSTLYSQAMRSIRAQLDWDGDGKADELRHLGQISLRRE